MVYFLCVVEIICILLMLSLKTLSLVTICHWQPCLAIARVGCKTVLSLSATFVCMHCNSSIIMTSRVAVNLRTHCKIGSRGHAAYATGYPGLRTDRRFGHSTLYPALHTHMGGRVITSDV